MKSGLAFRSILILLLAICIPAADDIQVLFSPGGNCTEAIVREIDAATSTIHIQAYSFTSKPIAKAVVAAQRRGVKVAVILDKSQKSEKYSSADFLAHAGVPTKIDEEHAIAHNKLIIIDAGSERALVIGGSFNFTSSAEERNAENVTIIRRQDITAIFLKNWLEHDRHSQVYAGR